MKASIPRICKPYQSSGGGTRVGEKEREKEREREREREREKVI